MMDSFVRRSNHFVRVGDVWILIYGPWKDFMDSQNSATVVLPWIEPPEPGWFTELPDASVDLLEWHMVYWHPGYYLAKLVPTDVYDRWLEWQHSRKRAGWRTRSGRVPCYPGRMAPFYDRQGEIVAEGA